MLSLLLSLKYVCTGCGNPVDSTLQWESQGTAENSGAVIQMPCPCCTVKNELVFTADGTIHAVWRARRYERVPEPSVN
jgi:hypothetical protein